MALPSRIEKRVRREFFPEDYARAVRLLTEWRIAGCAPGETATRMLTAVLRLARGDVKELKRAIADANIDYRDVLLWGESREFADLRAVECKSAALEKSEEAFLAAIKANPRDRTTRLVYADWLDDRDDPRGPYLRVYCEWLACRPDEAKELIAREKKLRKGLDRGWLARVRGIPVRERAKGKH
jgi:uncharacterized protein (TIGR02996 family)